MASPVFSVSITLSLSIKDWGFLQTSTWGFGGCLGHRWASEGGRSHLGQNAVQPLQRPIEVQLNPTGCGGYSLPTIFCTPTLDKTHADGATPCQLIDGLKALIHWLRKECCKLLVVEDLQVTARRNLTHLQLYKNKFQLQSKQ